MTDQPDQLHDNRRPPAIWLHRAIDDMALDPYEFRVYCHLCRRAGANGRAWPGMQSIAAKCGMSKRKVVDCLKALHQRGMIEVERRDSQTSRDTNIYTLTDADKWLDQNGQLLQGGGACGALPSARGALPLVHEVHSKVLKDKDNTKGPKTTRADLLKILTDQLPPEHADNDALIHQLNRWIDMRANDGKPLRAGSAKTAGQSLAKLATTPEDAAAIAEQSADNGWVGLFPLKVKAAQKQKGNLSKNEMDALFGF
jgi:DNA-binding MarR family transcriptional regulator